MEGGVTGTSSFGHRVLVVNRILVCKLVHLASLKEKSCAESAKESRNTSSLNTAPLLECWGALPIWLHMCTSQTIELCPSNDSHWPVHLAKASGRPLQSQHFCPASDKTTLWCSVWFVIFAFLSKLNAKYLLSSFQKCESIRETLRY